GLTTGIGKPLSRECQRPVSLFALRGTSSLHQATLVGHPPGSPRPKTLALSPVVAQTPSLFAPGALPPSPFAPAASQLRRLRQAGTGFDRLQTCGFTAWNS